MRKLIFIVFLLVALMGNISKVKAAGCTINNGIAGGRGDYTYDINSVEVKGKNLIIKGWGLLNSNGGTSKIHNIEPTYTLTLEGYNSTGTDVNDVDVNLTYKASKQYENYLSKNNLYTSYREANAKPNDYTEFYYSSTACSSPYRFYSGSDRSSFENGKALCAPSGALPQDKNYLYININFEFRIPLKDFTSLASQGANRVYLRLSITTDGQTKTVYGNQVPTTARKESCIPLTLQSSRVGDISLSSTDYTIRSVEDDTDMLTMMVVNGHPRPSRDYMNYWYYKYYDSTLKKTVLKKCTPGSSTCGTEVFYYQGTTTNSGDKGNYKVYGSPEEYYGYFSSIKEPIYLYKVKVALEYTKYGYTDYVISSSSGSIAYVPALWVKPYLQSLGTYFEIEDPTCPNDERCANLGATSTCPASCCDTYCTSGGGNEATPYCVNVCKGPGDGGNKCENVTDPQEKYCCLSDYSNQEVCSIYKRKDSSYTKNKKCNATTITTSEYKYPKEGYGDEQFYNTACKVSCEETIRVTFPKAISEVRAGMGFAYPIKIDSDRYCTAEYLNDTWKASLESAVTNLKNSYIEMTTNIDKAYTDDASCGNRAILDAGNVCTGGESLTSDGRCKKNIGFTSAPNSSSSSDTYRSSTSCSSGGAVWNCTTTTSSRTSSTKCTKNKKTGKTTCTTTYGPWSTSTSSFTATRCAGSYEGGSCYSYRGACPARSTWNSSLRRCEKIMCSNKTGTYFEDAQSAISPSISTANSARSRYLNALNIYNTLISDRNTCDNYTTKIKYNGASNTQIKIDASDEISQDAYSLTKSNSLESSVSAANKGTSYTISACVSKSTFIAKDSKYTDGLYPISGENLSLEYCNFNPMTYTYYDFWNKKTSANVEYEFSKEYSVMDYNGEILETANVPNNRINAYKNHGRYAYTDFYALSGKYQFTNTLSRIGANISSNNTNIFKLNFDCSYNINNLIFPQEDDSNHNLYGSVAFYYRQVSLKDMFPNRNPRENWAKPNAIALTNTIEKNGYSIYGSPPKYLITLTGNTMSMIRNYNSIHSYDDINIENPYTSKFITDYIRNGSITTNEKRGN